MKCPPICRVKHERACDFPPEYQETCKHCDFCKGEEALSTAIPPPPPDVTPIIVERTTPSNLKTIGIVLLMIVGVLLVVFLSLCAVHKLQTRRSAASRADATSDASSAFSHIEVWDENAGATALPEAWFPKYWTNAKYAASGAFDQMVYVGRHQEKVFDDLLFQTYRRKATQDRPCPLGKHEPTPGGCECVQPEGDPGLPRGYRVRRVIRVEHSDIWLRYVKRRRALQAKSIKNDSPAERLTPAADSDVVASAYPEIFEKLDGDMNEVYLWHGTPVRRALAIAQGTFNIHLAGTARGGGMYGPGVYLSESSTKADEYAQDEPCGYYDGVYALLLCRACLGRFYYTTVRNEKAHEQVAAGGFDSTCGDRLKSAGTFREFVIYDADQLYPEYVVLYSRIGKNDPPDKAMTELPFYMELPVYWRNCHRDPRKQPFHMQYKVRQSTCELLQRLVEGTLQSAGLRVSILSARRVENSTIWNTYVDFKQSLREKLRDLSLSRFQRAEDLDTTAGGGRVLTDAHLADERMEEAVSLDNIEESLNEQLLWHGTSREAAEAIAYDDFRIPRSADTSSGTRHGQRFGVGAYCSDSLGKSLSYAKDEGTSTRYVILCRVLCGDMYYTISWSDPSATQRAQTARKTCVLANPNKSGEREFISFTEDQMYPEYILELSVEEKTASASTPKAPKAVTLSADTLPAADTIGHTSI